MMTTVDEILKELQHDLVSCGWMLQTLSAGDSIQAVRESLSVILTDSIVIGDAIDTKKGHVKFVAWTGTREEQIERAIRRYASSAHPNNDYAFWLCLKQNVDEYEIS